jgi:hypothetical protein
MLEAFPDGLAVPTQPPLPPLPALLFQVRVQRCPTRHARNRDHEVPSRIADQTLDLALIVALGRSPELIGEQVVTLQLGEGPRPLPLFAAQYPCHGDLRVVVEYPRGHAAEICKSSHMAFEERLGGLGRERRHEAVVRVGQIHRQVVRLLFHSGDHDQRFTEVRLRLTRRMLQRHEHLPAAQLRGPNVVLHDRVAACETMLFSQPIEDPLGGVPLLGRPPLVIVQNGVDHAYPRPKLRAPDRLLSLVARWHRVLQHLPNRLSRQPKLPGYRTLTPALDTNRPTHTPVYLHLEHPSGVP